MSVEVNKGLNVGPALL